MKWRRWESTDRAGIRRRRGGWARGRDGRHCDCQDRPVRSCVGRSIADRRRQVVEPGTNRRARRWGRVSARCERSFWHPAPTSSGSAAAGLRSRRYFGHRWLKSARFLTAAASSNCASRNIGRSLTGLFNAGYLERGDEEGDHRSQAWRGRIGAGARAGPHGRRDDDHRLSRFKYVYWVPRPTQLDPGIHPGDRRPESPVVP